MIIDIYRNKFPNEKYGINSNHIIIEDDVAYHIEDSKKENLSGNNALLLRIRYELIGTFKIDFDEMSIVDINDKNKDEFNNAIKNKLPELFI